MALVSFSLPLLVNVQSFLSLTMAQFSRNVEGFVGHQNSIYYFVCSLAAHLPMFCSVSRYTTTFREYINFCCIQQLL